MYALWDEHRQAWAMGRHGRVTYSTHQMATVAARIMGKQDGCRYRAVQA